MLLEGVMAFRVVGNKPQAVLDASEGARQADLHRLHCALALHLRQVLARELRARRVPQLERALETPARRPVHDLRRGHAACFKNGLVSLCVQQQTPSICLKNVSAFRTRTCAKAALRGALKWCLDGLAAVVPIPEHERDQQTYGPRPANLASF